MNKRGALFFTMDTLIAGTILALTIILILNITPQTYRVEDTAFYMDTFTDYLMNTKMSEVTQIIYPYNTDTEGVSELRVHEQIHNLYFNENNETKAEMLVENIVNLIMPPGRGISYKIDNETIYFNSQEVIEPNVNLSRNILTYYRFEDQIYGPNVSVVTIWN